jgi:hypothetical protein
MEMKLSCNCRIVDDKRGGDAGNEQKRQIIECIERRQLKEQQW